MSKFDKNKESAVFKSRSDDYYIRQHDTKNGYYIITLIGPAINHPSHAEKIVQSKTDQNPKSVVKLLDRISEDAPTLQPVIHGLEGLKRHKEKTGFMPFGINHYTITDRMGGHPTTRIVTANRPMSPMVEIIDHDIIYIDIVGERKAGDKPVLLGAQKITSRSRSTAADYLSHRIDLFLDRIKSV